MGLTETPRDGPERGLELEIRGHRTPLRAPRAYSQEHSSST